VKATDVTAGLAESNGSLYRRVDGLVTCVAVPVVFVTAVNYAYRIYYFIFVIVKTSILYSLLFVVVGPF